MENNKGAPIVSHSPGTANARTAGEGALGIQRGGGLSYNHCRRTTSLRLQTKTKAGLRVMALLVFFVVLWLILSPILIMVKTSDLGDRLNRRIDDLEKRIDALRRGAAHPQVPEEPLSASLPPREMPPDLQRREEPEASPLAPDPSEPPSSSVPEHFEGPIVLPGASAEAAFDIDVPSAPFEPEAMEKPVVEDAVPDDATTPAPAGGSPFREPGPVAVACSRFLAWLLAEGNIWVCMGVLLFLVGFGLLFNYAIQAGLLTLEMRLAAAAVTGILMVAFGFRMRLRRRTYALVLQGGGMGVLYLVVLAAAKFHSLPIDMPILPEGPAVGAMLFLSVVTVVLALLQDYEPLALFAVLGGFAAPLLIQVGTRNPVMLFSACTLLNLEILVIAFRRRWRLLTRMGFLLSVAVSLFWGRYNWRPELFSSAEPFLLAFLVTYTLITVRFALVPGENGALDAANGGLRHEADMPLTLLVPLVFFLLQSHIAGHFVYGMALTCLGLGAGYLLLGAWLRRKGERCHPMMWRLFVALSVLFSNLVLPYAFERVLSSAVWAAEGAFLVLAACRYGSVKTLLGGIVLQMGALVLYAPELARVDLAAESRLSPILGSGILFSVALWCSGFWITRFRPREASPLHGNKWERWLTGVLDTNLRPACAVFSWILTAAGTLWWWWTLGDQVPRIGIPWLSAFSVACLTALAGSWASLRFHWPAARLLLFGPLVAGLLWTLGTLPLDLSPIIPDIFGTERSLTANALIYAAAFGLSLRLHHKTETGFQGLELLHFASLFVGLTLAGEALRQWGAPFGPDWARLLSILPLTTLLLHVSRVRERSFFSGPPESLAAAAGLPLLLKLPAFIGSFAWKGSSVQGIFVPFLNPLELWQAAFILSCVLWFRCLFAGDAHPFGLFRRGICSLLFVWVNQIAARAAWWYSGDSYSSIWEVLKSPHYQGIAAILWGILGLAGILRGKQTGSRPLWHAGAGLLAVDMVKLLFVDLNHSTTLTRIIAFLVLGGLFLLIGWAAPLPPREATPKGARDTAEQRSGE